MQPDSDSPALLVPAPVAAGTRRDVSDSAESESSDTETTTTFHDDVVATGNDITMNCDYLKVIATRVGGLREQLAAAFDSKVGFRSPAAFPVPDSVAWPPLLCPLIQNPVFRYPCRVGFGARHIGWLAGVYN